MGTYVLHEHTFPCQVGRNARCRAWKVDRESPPLPPHQRLVQEDRLLRLVAEPARDGARGRERPPDHFARRSRRGLELVLVAEVAFAVG